MVKCAAVIVTYFPDLSSLEHIKSLTDLCNKVIVIDNTPQRDQTPFPAAPNLTRYTFGENLGLAKALNKGIEIAGTIGLENIFLLDQDSYIPKHFFANMLKFKSQMDEKMASCAIYVPDFWDRNSKSPAKFPIVSKFSIKHVTCKDMASFQKHGVVIAITSGTLITYSMYKTIGPFKESYFIDFIDNEYCLRASRLGCKVVVNCNVVLNHSIGRRSKHSFVGLTIKPNHHAPVRRYYIFRNGIRTALDYFRYYPSYSLLLVARLSHEMLSILLYENDKQKKFRAILYGTYHGLAGITGKCRTNR